MSTDYWMLEEDLCRCCHSEGTFQNLAGAFNFGDEEENMYLNMLRDTLDVNISPVSGSLCSITFTICDTCVKRLHDATIFKKQVVRCEQKFNDLYRRNFIKLAEPDYKMEVKEEEPERDIENAVELRDDDSWDDSFDVQHDDDEESSVNRINQEGKKKAKKTPQKAKAKLKPKKPPKKCGRPRKVKDIKQEEAVGDKDETEDSKFKPVTSKLEQLLTQDGTCQDFLFIYGIEDGDTFKYVCRNCHKSFVDKDSVRNHIQISNTYRNKNNISKIQIFNYMCDVCSKEYPNKRSLQMHVQRTHKPIKCRYCDLKFLRRNLNIHHRETHGLQLPSCGICGYRHWDKSRVTNHQRNVHMNEKNVSCNQCGKQFFDAFRLSKHMIVHGADRKFKCSFCNKKFPRRSTLSLHEKIHTKIKDKVCSVCGEGFVQKASLNYHIKKYHPEAV